MPLSSAPDRSIRGIGPPRSQRARHSGRPLGRFRARPQLRTYFVECSPVRERNRRTNLPRWNAHGTLRERAVCLVCPVRSRSQDAAAKRRACFAVYSRLVAGPSGETGHVLIYGGRRPLLLRPSSQVSPPVAVAVTTTPSGAGGIELEHMEHAVDPSRCATNVPQDHCSMSVLPDHDGGPKPLTCANIAWLHRARTNDLRIENEQAARPSGCGTKMCHLPLLPGRLGGMKSRS